MSKLELLKKAITENKDRLIEESKEIYKMSMSGNYGLVGLVIDIKGNISKFTNRTPGMQSIEEYQGNAITVIQYDNNDVPEYNFYEECRTYLEENNRMEEFIEYCMNKFEVVAGMMEYYITYENIKDFDVNILKQLDENQIEFITDMCYDTAAVEQIENTLESIDFDIYNERERGF